ncbi:MAG: ATP-grasp domain-containing protein [Betaproteobacteria bacterium]|nr:ATP-grasp domain-containing protein [Betaproteobacteria bacterium]
MKRILVLFPKEWDKIEFAREGYRDFEFVFAGFDLFRFPDNAHLLTFRVRHFIDQLVERFRREPLDGVLSNNEYFGALVAAVVAERLGLPGTPPMALITAQHKYYSRLAQAKVAPEAVPRFAVFPYDRVDPAEIGLPFPFFVKPVRATFSVLARRVANADELRRHMRLSLIDTFIIKRLVRPFNDLAADYTGFDLNAHHMIAEELLSGLLINIDGYARNGSVRFLGMVDALLFPGTDAFMRFEYPSRVPAAERDRMYALAARVLEGLGFDHGFFNVEIFWRPDTGELKILEVNPRLASQLAGLYRRVDGVNAHRMLLDLCTGTGPALAPQPTGAKRSASFVFRKFDGKPLRAEPSAAALQSLRQRHPEADLMCYFKRGRALARELKWLGSYRYALLNMAGADEEDLLRCYQDICAILGFDDEQAVGARAYLVGDSREDYATSSPSTSGRIQGT